MKSYSDKHLLTYNHKCITYIIQSGRFHKIGKTTNLSNRLKQYSTHNPDYQLTMILEGDYEDYLHYYFQQYLYKTEWFIFPEDWKDLLDHSDYKNKSKLFKKIPKPAKKAEIDPKFIELLESPEHVIELMKVLIKEESKQKSPKRK